MILKMSGGRSKIALGWLLRPAAAAETFVGVLIVLGEIETVLDEQSAGKSVIANAIATHPGIQKGASTERKEETSAPICAAMRRRCTEILLIHERAIREKLSQFRLPLR